MRRCRPAVIVPVALVGGLLVPRAVCDGVTFLFPTGGETFTFPNTVVNISYITPFPAPQLFVWCGSFGSKVRHIRTELVKPFTNFHLTPINFTNSDKCWFNLRPNATQDLGDNSGGFSIIADESAKSTTVGLATAPRSTSTTPPSGAVAGISVGATLVAALICAAALAFWWASRRHAQNGGSSQSRWTAFAGFRRKPGGASGEEEPLAIPVSGPAPWQTANSLSNTTTFPRHTTPGSEVGGTSPSSRAATVAAPAAPFAAAAPVASTGADADRDAAELPSLHTYRGWGGEQEMPVSETGASRPPHLGHGPEAAEQKFLLQDMQALKTQRRPPNPPDPVPGPYFAG
ncbi:hypothetical protein MAPG_08106 [Magnaporthiopsis poae ATCC 64411]|uniref:Transmembrane protein n=1 Tax=Magnaporthiopsis poae (strain ATCC 64411 / 73-15) TaxID=644358 RepID=A0A0C4E6G6_MAGP6|nr:hypothetical protein MAPG_08106 [Magnaporthiopsis poae ATCC 64411]